MKPRRHRFTLSIRLIVILSAALPLGMMTFLTADAIRDARHDERLAADVQTLSGEVEALVAVESSLTIERYWGSAVVALSNLGLTSDAVEAIVGIDIGAEFGMARTAVDEALELARVASPDFDLTEIESSLASVRSAITASEVDAAGAGVTYEVAEDALGAKIDRRIDDITASSVELGALDGVIESTQLLAMTVELREYATDVATAVFGTRFPVESGDSNVVLELVSSWTQYENLSQAFETTTDNGSALLALVQDDPAVTAFLQRAAEQVDIATGVAEQADTALDLDSELSLFNGSLALMDRHLRLVDLAADRVRADADVLVAVADESAANAMLRGTIAAAVTLVLVLVATRWIIDPLRSVSRRATRMLEGDLDDDPGRLVAKGHWPANKMVELPVPPAGVQSTAELRWIERFQRKLRQSHRWQKW